jgi:hypothetical protein
MMSKQVMHGDKTVTVSAPVSNRGGTLQARAAALLADTAVLVAGAVPAAAQVEAQAVAPTEALAVEARVAVLTEAEAPVDPAQAAAVCRRRASLEGSLSADYGQSESDLS